MDPEVLKKLLDQSRKLEGNCQGVYFLFDEEEVVYIGKGWNCLLRIAENTRKESNKVFTSWNYLPVEDEEDLHHFERHLIETLKPKYNITYKSS